jgi:DnaJ-class molecular chaperone
MTFYPVLIDKYCFVYCGPERCNCKRGNLALKYEPCPVCDGVGFIKEGQFFDPAACSKCKGKGKVKSRDRYGRFLKIKNMKTKSND